MKNTEAAFLWIIDLLEKKNIQYKISGGFAARIYGVNRDLADIDIEMSDQNVADLAENVKPYIIFGPDRYIDTNWDLMLMTLSYEGQEIDIAGTGAHIFNQVTQQWETASTNLDNVTLKEIYGKTVPVENVQDLIAYKKKLGREVDLEDVKQLSVII